MKIYITLDYELFFGSNSGSAQHCIIRPTDDLLKILDPMGVKITFFVDVGYLMRMESQMNEFPKLRSDYDAVSSQIRKLADEGHGIDLHIHPHWEDSFFDGNSWKFDHSRYKLSDFSDEEVMEIVTRYKDTLERISGYTPKAYRAGGWSAQPFLPIKKALAANGVFIDSTVYSKGYYQSQYQVFDFREVSQFKTQYRFSDDLTIEDPEGEFLEIPISSQRVSPLFFWRFAMVKLSKAARHRAYGNGSAVKMSDDQIFRLLTRPSHSVVSIDGYKSSIIQKAFQKYQKETENKGNFVLIGHPKAFTPYSLKQLAKFVKDTHKDHQYVIFS